jgi:hypothetical protein
MMGECVQVLKVVVQQLQIKLSRETTLDSSAGMVLCAVACCACIELDSSMAYSS